MKTIVLVFSFEELNTNVLLNSVIRNQKERHDFRYAAYAPPGFSKLFFGADEIITIPENINSFRRYSEISEYLPIPITFIDKVKRRIRFKIQDLILNLIIMFKPSNQLLLAMLRVIPSPRQKKYLYDSGIFKYIKNHARQKFGKDIIVVVVQDFLVFSAGKFSMSSKSLDQSFRYYFKEHYEAISNGLKLQPDQPVLPGKNPRVVFRTRNYLSKQPEHNTKIEDVLPLVRCFIENKWNVVNIGSPALSLIPHLTPVERSFFTEISNKLTIDEEFKYFCYPVVCRADAGLFVLLATVDTPLILLSKEWSEHLNVTLVDARNLAGLLSTLDLSNNEEPLVVVKRFIKLQEKCNWDAGDTLN